MKRAFGFLAISTAAIALTGCEFSIGGPSEDDIRQSIVDHYESEGYEGLSVQLDETEDGGYTGIVTYTVSGDDNVRGNLECVVDPVEDGEAAWRCGPGASDLAQLVVDSYTERGAKGVYSELTAQTETQYTGYVEFDHPQTGQRVRHDCTVDLIDGDATWQCRP
ncbi:MAG: hypothetical protein AAGE05_14375 [Pseudomonadota bacterium]